MKTWTKLACAGLLALMPHGAWAQNAGIPGTLVNDPASLQWEFHGANAASTPVKNADVQGGAAVRVTVKSANPNPWDVGLAVPLTANVKAGEVVTAGFWARTVASSAWNHTGAVALRFQITQPPYSGFADTTLQIGTAWKWYEVSATATTDLAKGGAAFAINMGTQAQTLEIGQAIIVKGAAKIADSVATVPLPPALTNLGTLLNDPRSRDWVVIGDAAAVKPLTDKTVPLGAATHFSSPSASDKPWVLGASLPLDQGIAEGDRIVLAVVARTLSAGTADGKGVLGLRIQDRGSASYDGFINASAHPGPNWQLLQLRTTAPISIPAGRAEVALHVGGAKQEIEVGAVYVIRMDAAPAAK